MFKKTELLVSFLLLLLSGIMIGGCASGNNSAGKGLIPQTPEQAQKMKEQILADVQVPTATPMFLLNIVKPDSDAPSDSEGTKALYGQWFGIWSNEMRSIISIEDVEKTRVRFYYCWGGEKRGNNQVWGHFMPDGSIKATLGNGSILRVAYNKQNNTLEATFERTGTDVIAQMVMWRPEDLIRKKL